MNIEKKNGYWIISDIISNYRIERKYMFYTKKEAIQKFKKEVNVKENK